MGTPLLRATLTLLVLVEVATASFSSEADRIVSLPGLPDDLQHLSMYSGYLTTHMSSEDVQPRKLFYWLVEAEQDAHSAPLVLWLQGGPGASSLFSLFTETGPFRMAETGSGLLESAPVRWTAAASMLYLDQPYGTGFSFASSNTSGGVVHNETQLRDAAAAAIVQFFGRHPQYISRPFYIFGESFAGHMAPNIAYRLLELKAQHAEEASNHSSGFPVNLCGLAIGDGWVEPTLQNAAFPEFAFATGLISDELRSALDTQSKECAKVIASGNYTAAFYGPCYYQMLNPIVEAAGGVSPYDIRKFGDSHDDFKSKALQQYLDNNRVRDALHLPHAAASGKWGQGAGSTLVEQSLIPDLNAPTSLPLWPSLLARGLHIMVYNGNMDLICNHLGTDAYVRHSLHWPGRAKFMAAHRQVWKLQGSVAGWSRSASNFTQIVVANAGHMAPSDSPAACFDMMKRFVGTGWPASPPQVMVV